MGMITEVRYPGNREILWAIAFLCLSCCAILMLFQPFGVNNYDPSESIRLELMVGIASLGLVMFVTFLINEFALRPRVIKTYNVLTVACWLLWAIILGGSVAYVNYNFLGNWHDWSLPSWLDFVKNWFILTALPLAMIILYFRQKFLHQKLQEAQINQEDHGELFIFTSDNQKDRIALAVNDILFLESEDNYVSLTYRSGGEAKRHLLRSTLTRMETELEDTPIVRCHRSFLVNLDNVSSFTGNKNRLELTLGDSGELIPASRKFSPAILARLEDRSR